MEQTPEKGNGTSIYSPVTTSYSSQESMPPTTTAQEDETTKGQRRINLIWEWTQATIAIVVVMSTMVAGIYSGVKHTEFPLIIGVAFGTIIGFYFARTNHQAIGGVGAKANDDQKYVGR